MLAAPLEAPRLELALRQVGPEMAVAGAFHQGRVAEHAVVGADHFVGGVAHGAQEVVVRAQHIAAQIEFDHGLRAPNRLQFALDLGVLQLLQRDVGGELDDLDRLAVGVEDRVVRGQQPDFLAGAGHAAVLAGVEFATSKAVPEGQVLGRTGQDRIAEHAVVLAADLVECIAHGVEEVGVRAQHPALQIELDDGLDPVDRFALAFVVGIAQGLFGDVGGVLDDLAGLAVGAEHRVVRGADPDFAPGLVAALELAGMHLALAQVRPEQRVFGRRHVGRIAEQAVMLAQQLVERIAERIEEFGVGVQDAAVETEFDHGLDPVDGVDLGRVLGLLQPRQGNVGRKLDHLDRPAVAVEHRVVRGLQPDRHAVAPQAHVLALARVPADQGFPEHVVGLGSHVVRRAEQAVVTAHDLAQRIAHRVQEILVRMQDMTLHVEFDHGLGALDGVEGGVGHVEPAIGGGENGGNGHCCCSFLGECRRETAVRGVRTVFAIGPNNGAPF